MVELTADLSAKFEKVTALMLSAPVVRLPDIDVEVIRKKMVEKWQSEPF